MTFHKNTTAYLNALNLTFTEPDITFLDALQSAHISKFTFNSLAVLLNGQISIDSESVFKKIVIEQRGGYCFEHNKLVYDVLTDLGFETTIVIAKVGPDINNGGPRTHRITLVTIDNDRYIVDAGFGPSSTVYPIKLAPLIPQQQGDNQYRVQYVESIDEYTLDVLKNEEFVTLYCFNKNYYNEADCNVANFYSYKHPEAAFVNNIVVSSKTINETKSLRNGLFLHTINNVIEELPIHEWQDLQLVLRRFFTIELSNNECGYLFDKFINNKELEVSIIKSS